MPGHIETKVADLVYSEMSKEIEGTFSRMMANPFLTPSAESSVSLRQTCGDINLLFL